MQKAATPAPPSLDILKLNVVSMSSTTARGDRRVAVGTLSYAPARV